VAAACVPTGKPGGCSHLTVAAAAKECGQGLLKGMPPPLVSSRRTWCTKGAPYRPPAQGHTGSVGPGLVESLMLLVLATTPPILSLARSMRLHSYRLFFPRDHKTDLWSVGMKNSRKCRHSLPGTRKTWQNRT